MMSERIDLDKCRTDGEREVARHLNTIITELEGTRAQLKAAEEQAGKAEKHRQDAIHARDWIANEWESSRAAVTETMKDLAAMECQRDALKAAVVRLHERADTAQRRCMDAYLLWQQREEWHRRAETAESARDTAQERVAMLERNVDELGAANRLLAEGATTAQERERGLRRLLEWLKGKIKEGPNPGSWGHWWLTLETAIDAALSPTQPTKEDK
jgi:chromosome segregation ATPase